MSFRSFFFYWIYVWLYTNFFSSMIWSKKCISPSYLDKPSVIKCVFICYIYISFNIRISFCCKCIFMNLIIVIEKIYNKNSKQAKFICISKYANNFLDQELTQIRGKWSRYKSIDQVYVFYNMFWILHKTAFL